MSGGAIAAASIVPSVGVICVVFTITRTICGACQKRRITDKIPEDPTVEEVDIHEIPFPRPTYVEEPPPSYTEPDPPHYSIYTKDIITRL